MSLRPWNVFKKTLYAAGKESLALGAVPLTTKLSLARARAQSEELKAANATSYGQRLALLLPPSVLAWLLLLAAWSRYSDADRLRDLERRSGGAILLDLLGWRLVAHLGPYQIPNFSHARLHEEPLRMLRESLLLDYEHARALGRLEQLSQRRHAAPSLSAIEPVLAEAFRLERTKEASASQQAAVARIILDVVAATPPTERAVPAWVLDGLVSSRDSPWASPQGEELRATLLCQLLRTPANCLAASCSPQVCAYLQQPGLKVREDTPWPLKAYLLSGETPDLMRRGQRLVNRHRPGTVPQLPAARRDTPNLETKRDLRNLWTTVLLTSAWGAARAWTGILETAAVLAMARSSAGALLGMGVLEALWRAEEHVIQSEMYHRDARAMLGCSLGMCALHCALGAWALRFPVAVPFVFCRVVKDDFMDTHRSFEV